MNKLQHKYNYLGYIPFDYPEVKELVIYIDKIVRPWWCPLWLANKIHSVQYIKSKYVSERFRIRYVKWYGNMLRDWVFKSFKFEDMKWKFGHFNIDYTIDYRLPDKLKEEIDDRIGEVENQVKNNHEPRG